MRKYLLAIIVLALTACAGRAPENAPSPFSVSVQPAIAGEANRIAVHDDSSTSASIEIVMRMTDMDMPPVHATLQRAPSGDYVAENIQFSMSGKWTIGTPAQKGRQVQITVR